MKKLDISIGILTWKRLDVLRQTLNSYKQNGLLSISDDITIFFQEIGEKEIKLANEFGVKYLGNKSNIVGDIIGSNTERVIKTNIWENSE